MFKVHYLRVSESVRKWDLAHHHHHHYHRHHHYTQTPFTYVLLQAAAFLYCFANVALSRLCPSKSASGIEYLMDISHRLMMNVSYSSLYGIVMGSESMQIFHMIPIC